MVVLEALVLVLVLALAAFKPVNLGTLFDLAPDHGLAGSGPGHLLAYGRRHWTLRHGETVVTKDA